MVPNLRGLVRHELNATIDIWDALTDAHLGRLVNINGAGLMIMTDQKLVVDKLYQLRLSLPQALSAAGDVSFGADCLWVKASGEEQIYWAGCQIIDISAAGLAAIELLVSRFNLS